jgi:hypothetical protein
VDREAEELVAVGLNAMHAWLMLEGTDVEIRRLYNETPWQDVQRAIATEDFSLCTRLIQWRTDQLNEGDR